MRRVLAGVVAGAVALLIAVPSTSTARPNVDPDLKRSGVLVVGTDTPYPPFEFGEPPNYRGFDMDLIRGITRQLRLKLVIVDTAFDTIFSDVANGKFDLAASATTITPHRKQVVSFSKPYYESRHALVVRKGSPINSLRQLRNRVVGVQTGTSAEYFAMRQIRTKTVKSYPSGAATLAALKRRKVGAVLIDDGFARRALHRGTRKIKIAKTISTGEWYGFAVAKESRKLRRGVNWALARLDKNGTYPRLYRKWFHRNPPQSLRR